MATLDDKSGRRKLGIGNGLSCIEFWVGYLHSSVLGKRRLGKSGLGLYGSCRRRKGQDEFCHWEKIFTKSNGWMDIGFRYI